MIATRKSMLSTFRHKNAAKLGESTASKMLCSTLLIKDLPQTDEINNAKGKKTNDLKTITRIEFIYSSKLTRSDAFVFKKVLNYFFTLYNLIALEIMNKLNIFPSFRSKFEANFCINFWHL